MSHINHWIPACAGMTEESEQVFCQSDNPSAIPADYLTPAPSSFMDRKSCMRREGRMPVAARRRPESRRTKPGCQADEGFRLMVSFPPCGNVSYKPLDSSLRWNDDLRKQRHFTGLQHHSSKPHRHSGLPAAGRRRLKSRRARSVCRYCGKVRVICVFGNVFNPQQSINQLESIRKVLLV